MSVLSESTGQGDVVLFRDATNRWGIRWEQSEDGTTFSPVDLTGWTGVLQLRSSLGDVWLSVPTVSEVSGLTTATVTPADLAASAWAARPGGSWTITLTAPDGHSERLGQGYFHLEA